MKKLNKILFSLIAPVLCGANAELGAELDEQTLRSVYALAKKHDVGHLLAQGVRNAECEMQNRCAKAQMQNAECKMQNEELALSKREATCEYKTLMAELERAELTAVWRVRNIENEQGRVRKCLEEAEIPFILLKGAVVRSLYPEAWMRTSSDIDVLVPRNELSHAVAAIEDGLGYRISTTEPHDASLYAKSGVHLDMHSLFEGDREDCKLLDTAWACATDNGGFEHFLTAEHFYFYHMAHMAAHMRNGGCGIRPFIDLYLIRHNTECDRAILNAMLSEYGLDRFEAAAVILSDMWMCGAAVNAESVTGNSKLSAEELAAFEEYVLTGGVYGSSEQYVAARQRGENRGKVRYILGRIFMPYEQLKKRHPVLEKHRYLTPFFEIYRWCGLLVPARFRRSRKELSSAMRVDGDKITSVEELLDGLGL